MTRIICVCLALAWGAGCTDSRPAATHYPIPTMLDPVTEGTPHVIVTNR